MKLKVNVKKLSQVSTPEEKAIINTIIDTLPFERLKKIVADRFNEDQLLAILREMYDKKIIFATPADLLLEKKTEQEKITLSQSDDQKDDQKRERLKDDIDQMYEKMEKRSIYYDIFTVMPSATAKEIKLRYFELSRKFHPDRVHKFHLDQRYQRKADHISIQLTNIYNILKNSSKRKEYNQSIGLKKRGISGLGGGTQKGASKEKIEEFSTLAIQEYRQQNYDKALKLIKMAISYGSKDNNHIQLKRELEGKIKEYERVKFKKKIDQLMAQRDYQKALLVIECQLDKGKNPQLYLQKASIMQYISPSQNAEYIIEAYQEALKLDSRSISAREKFIQFLAFIERKELLVQEIEALLKIDPKNKIAKKHTKRSLWSMFSVSI